MNSDSVKKWSFLALIGIISRGVIFFIMGILIVLSVLQQAPDKKADSVGVLHFIDNNPFGKLILIFLGIGVAIYIAWRIKLMFNVDSSKSVLNKTRLVANHAGIAIIYLLFLSLIIKVLFDIKAESAKLETYLNSFANDIWFEVLIAIIGLSIIGKGIFQFYISYSKIFLKLIKERELSSTAQKTFIAFGQIGYFARGIVFSTLGFLIFRTSYSIYSNPNKDVKDALDYIDENFGNVVLLAIGVGLFLFSLFVFIKAKYRIIEVSD